MHGQNKKSSDFKVRGTGWPSDRSTSAKHFRGNLTEMSPELQREESKSVNLAGF
jgi:hypothetical protein